MIRPNVPYTKEQVAEMRDSPELADLLLRGYVFTLTLDGWFVLVPWNEAAGGGHRGKDYGMFDPASGGSKYGRPVTHVFSKEELREQLPPIVRRTPQQRLESLMDKVAEDLQHYLSGQAGKIITGEETRRVAAQALQDAETEFKKAEDKRFARTTGDPYA